MYVARFLVRSDGLFLFGTPFKGQTALIPDHLYEIRELCNEMVIIDKGESVVPKSHWNRPVNKLYGDSPTWGSDIRELIHYGSELYLSQSEYIELINKIRG